VSWLTRPFVFSGLAGIAVDQLRGLSRPLHAGETCHVPGRRFVPM